MGQEEMISESTWWLLGSLSAATFVGTLIAIPIIVIRMAPDYFMPHRNHRKTLAHQHRAIRWTGLVLKNVLGFVLVIAGIIMSVPLVPGQGLLTILIGLVLINFPGKRRFEVWLVSRKTIHGSINWIRRKAHRDPLQLPHPDEAKPAPYSTGMAEPSDRD